MRPILCLLGIHNFKIIRGNTPNIKDAYLCRECQRCELFQVKSSTTGYCWKNPFKEIL